MADCARLESAYTERYRGFDSRPLRFHHAVAKRRRAQFVSFTEKSSDKIMRNNTLKQRAPRNRTITLSDNDISVFKKRLVKINNGIEKFCSIMGDNVQTKKRKKPIKKPLKK